MTEPTLSEQPTRGPWVTAGAWLLLVGAMTAAFGHNFVEMWRRWYPAWKHSDLSLYDRFVEGQSYYTHGPIIPLVSLFIVILLIRHVKMSVRPNRKLGGAVLGGSLLLHLVACLARVNFASGFAFIGVLIGLVLWLWGDQALRQLWFPIVLLVFMVPLPEVTIYSLNYELKMFAANLGVTLANALGVIVERSGNRVFLHPDKNLVIANVCNGLRTLISLLAFGAMYCYVCRLRGLWRLGLFAMTVPVAVVANSIRIVSLIVVADTWDEATATGAYHDWSGIFIFVLAFLFMFGIERLVLWVRKVVGRPAEVLPLFHGRTLGPQDPPQWPPMCRAVGSARGFAVGGVMVLVAVGAWWAGRTVPSALTPEMVAHAVPAILGVDGQDLHSRAIPLDEKTLTILEHPSYLYRRYSGADGRPIDYCLIFSKDNRKGTHPPDRCLAGKGDVIVAKDSIVLDDVKGRGSVPCRELVTEIGANKHYFIYTYKCGDRYTGSFWTQQLVIFANGLLNRNASGALIRVSTPVDAGVPEARARCMAVLRASVYYLDRNLP